MGPPTTNHPLATVWLLVGLLAAVVGHAGTKHSAGSAHPTYHKRVMCGYQGWFRADGDAVGRGWGHYGGRNGFGPDSVTIDLWPDVSEYDKTYPAPFEHADGRPAQLFSSHDATTTDLHFRWMKQYGIDGVFMQRFFGVARNRDSGPAAREILANAFDSAERHGRAAAVMYDLSGLKPDEDTCDSLIEDWKRLVDDLKLTSRGADQAYLYHDGGPLVAIWGVGFPDRPYDIREIGLERLIDFLKNDPEYGGCSVMLGAPTYFRTLDGDCRAEPYLHELIESADIVMPWMVQRFTPLLHVEMKRYTDHVRADLAWCRARGVEYAPLVYPGFSWHNLSQQHFDGRHPLDQIPRQGGKFYWGLIHGAVSAGADMLYVAMFDEIDEGTAIFKCTNDPPVGFPCLTYEGLPSDHYLWLTGEGGRMLRGETSLTEQMPERSSSPAE